MKKRKMSYSFVHRISKLLIKNNIFGIVKTKDERLKQLILTKKGFLAFNHITGLERLGLE